jgi:hypothetical protein
MRRFLLVAAALFGIFGNAALPSARADLVSPGFDLFQTTTGTMFQGVPFQGVPLGSFDFGGTIGVKNVGSTDTIIQRLQGVASPSGTTTLLMPALQLESSVPANFGAGVGFYFITLQSARVGGPPSTGAMTINFAPNNLSSTIDVFFDLRFGAVNGLIVLSSDLVLTTASDLWQHPPTGALQIDGVNHKLNGTDETTDFWPVSPLILASPNGLTLVLQDPQPQTPEPTSLTLLGSGLVALGGFHLRRWRRRPSAT